MRTLGLWLDDVDDIADSLIKAINPSHFIVAENAFGYIPRLRELVPDALIIVRDTYNDIGGDAYINQKIQEEPRTIGTMLAQRMINNISDKSIILHDFNEPPVETGDQCLNLSKATYAFHDIVHQAGYKHIGLNLNTGGPGKLDYWTFLRDAYNACDYIGVHLYSLAGEDDEWTAFRYSKYPDWAKVKPIISTEGGYDAVGIGGWRAQGLNDNYVQVKFGEIMNRWANDKVRGTWFGIGFINQDQWGSFLPTHQQVQYWGTINKDIEEELPMPEKPMLLKAIEANGETPISDEFDWGGLPAQVSNKGMYVATNHGGEWFVSKLDRTFPLVQVNPA